MSRLTAKHFSFKCPMNWEEMEVSSHGRFCSQCRKEVFDLTNCSLEEVAALQRKHGPICGSIRLAVVATSLAAAACQDTATVRTTGTPMPVKTEPHDMVVGKVCLPESGEKPDNR